MNTYKLDYWFLNTKKISAEIVFNNLKKISNIIDNYVLFNAVKHQQPLETLFIRNKNGYDSWLYRLSLHLTEKVLYEYRRDELLSHLYTGHFWFNGNKRRKLLWQYFLTNCLTITNDSVILNVEQEKEYERLVFA